MTEEGLDAGEVTQRVRDDNASMRWVPVRPGDRLTHWHRWRLMNEESLHYLHRHWVLPDRADDVVAGRGVKGKLIRRFARLTFRVLGPYLREEREVLANVVRTDDALAHRYDELVDEITRRQTEEAESDTRLATWLYDALASSPPPGHLPEQRP